MPLTFPDSVVQPTPSIGRGNLPIATTTISISRGDDVYTDATEDVSRSTVATGIRAHFSTPSGIESVTAGSQERIDWRLICDPCDLGHNDLVTDETTGEIYGVVWAHPRSGLGLDHVEAGVRRISGDQ